MPAKRKRTFATLASAARAYARAAGVKGGPGGWLYTASGSKLAQGWHSYGCLLLRAGAVRMSGDNGGEFSIPRFPGEVAGG